MAVHLSEERKADYSDFLKRFKANPQSISAEEAAQRYQDVLRHATPEMAADANQHILGLLPQDERDVLATDIRGGGQTPQTIGLLDHILGKDSVLNTPLGKMILSAAVAYLMNRMLNQSQSQSQGQTGTQAPSGGLGDLISTILGGVAAAQSGGTNQVPASGMPGNQIPAGGGLPGGLGDILGVLLGGQASSGSQMPSGNQAPAGGLPGGLGDILGALLGGGESSDLPEAPRTGPEPEQQPPVRSHRKQ